MKYVSGVTKNEKKLVCGIQAAVDSVQDNSLGQQTLLDVACKLNADIFPICLDIFSQPVIVARDIRPARVSAPLKNYALAISGSFIYRGKPCSILICDGSALSTEACHYWISGTPESVLYRTVGGKYGICRCRTVKDLPSGIRWAVGGLGLLDNYDPAAEGFVGAYSDVLRKTAHTYIGIKHEMCYIGYVGNATAKQVNDYAKKMGFNMAIMLDGGSQAAINSEETHINTLVTQQNYIVQALP